MQTHLEREPRRDRLRQAAVSRGRKTYLDVYDALRAARPALDLRPLHPSRGSEVAALASAAAIAAFCPTSNLFLGSGLFDKRRLDEAGVRVALATDVGGGTSYSMLQTADEGYKVLQMNGQSWPAAQAFYQMTLGNARALSLEDRIGAIEAGREADLVVLDSRATPAMAHRMEAHDGDLAEELFVLMTMGDDRAVGETYVAGAGGEGGVRVRTTSRVGDEAGSRGWAPFRARADDCFARGQVSRRAASNFAAFSSSSVKFCQVLSSFAKTFLDRASGNFKHLRPPQVDKRALTKLSCRVTAVASRGGRLCDLKSCDEPG